MLFLLVERMISIRMVIRYGDIVRYFIGIVMFVVCRLSCKMLILLKR